MRAAAARRVAGWRVNDRVNAQDESGWIGMDVILEVVLGFDPEDASHQALKQLLWDALWGFKPSNIFVPVRVELFGLTAWGRFQKRRRKFVKMLLDEIHQRRDEARERDDILSLLMNARDDDGSPAFSDSDLISHIVTFLAAGFETTATTVPWVLRHVLQHPDVHARLLRELDSGDDAYLEACIKESMRLSPTIPEVPRKVERAFSVGDVELAAGDVVVAAVRNVHRDPARFGDPDDFRPARFLEQRFSPHEYLPFGGGFRKCIGWAFAMQQMKIVLAAMLHNFELAPLSAASAKRRNLSVGIADGLPLVVTARRASIFHFRAQRAA